MPVTTTVICRSGSDIGPNLFVDFTPLFDIADVNRDESVDSLDFYQISDDMFELTEDLTGVHIYSDIDASGLVDFADFRIWKETPQGAAAWAAMQVPEPSSLIVLGTSLLLIGSVRRRRCD